MARIEWEGIPESYWPDTTKPWRVTWGFGAFQDFATLEEAQERAAYLREVWAGRDWADMVRDPYDVVAHSIANGHELAKEKA